MATMNPGIILNGQQPDIVNALRGGIETARLVNDARRQNALADLYQTQGAGIAAGDQNALNALAAFDPMQALRVQDARLGMDQTRQTMDMQRQQNDRLNAQERRAVEDHVSTLSTRQRAEEAQKIEDAVKFGMALPNAEAWDAHMGANPDTEYLVGQFEQRQGHANRYLEIAEILKGPGGNTEADRELARLGSIGIPRDVAIKIKESVYKVVTDPVTRESMVIDLSNGQPVYRVDPTGGEQQPTQPSAPQAASPQLTFGGNASDAFGAEGFIKGAANKVADVFGAGVPYEGVQDTQSDFGVLREQMLNDMASAYDRQPPSWLLEEIRELTPQAGSLREGASGAQSKMRALKRHFESELSLAEQALRRRMSPDERQKAEAKASGLRAAIGRVDAALGRFSTGQQQQTSSGVTWSIEE